MTATLAHERIEVEDTAVAALRFKNGALGVIEAATSAYPGLLKRTEIHGDRGSARVEQDDITLWEFQEKVPSDNEVFAAMAGHSGFKAGASDPRGITHIGHRDQLADFLQAIEQGRPPAVDGREGRKSVEIIRAIYRSAKTGQAVHLAARRSDALDCAVICLTAELDSRINGVTAMPRHKVAEPGSTIWSICSFARSSRSPRCSRSSSRMPWRGSSAGCSITVDKRHRQVGLENLQHALRRCNSEAERDQIVRGVYRHFCMMLMEILHLPRKLHLTNWRDRITLVGHEPIFSTTS